MSPGDDLEARLRRRSQMLAVNLPEDAAPLLAEYLRLLAHWNKTINLTALPLEGFAESSLDRLVMEPLAVAGYLDSREVSWLDLGSGGGSPAIPLKIVRPAFRLTMVEARERKSAFLREVVRSLPLSGATVATGRFEDLPAGDADLITTRAVRLDESALRAVARLMREGGRFAVLGSPGSLQVPISWDCSLRAVLPTGSELSIISPKHQASP